MKLKTLVLFISFLIFGLQLVLWGYAYIRFDVLWAVPKNYVAFELLVALVVLGLMVDLTIFEPLMQRHRKK